MSAADKIRKIHNMFKGLDEIADLFDKLDAMENREREHQALIAKFAAEAKEAAEVKSKAQGDADAIKAQAKEQAGKILADAHAKAQAIEAKAEESAKAAVNTVAAKGQELRDLEAKTKEAADALTGILARVADAEKTEGVVKARIEKIKADLLKQMG